MRLPLRRSLAAAFLGLMLCGLSASAAGGDVLRFDTADIALQASRVYDGLKGLPNPFEDVQLQADVTSPSGRRFSVDGFFDGDGGNGASGSAGKVFKLRIYADEAGLWTWTTTSNDPGLNDRSGSFTCSGKLAGVFGAGAIVRDPARPRFVRYQEGRAVYLLGKFLDKNAPSPLQWSQTFLSEKLTEADRKAMLQRHLGMKLTKMSIYLADKMDYAGVAPTTPWVGTSAANDKARFDLERWRMYDRWILELRRQGLAAQLWFFADDSGFGNLPDADRKRLIRYGMARLSGYANTLFTLALEWEEGWTVSEVESHALYLQEKNPWRRLASVHGQIGDFDFPKASWADYLDLQAGTTSHLALHQFGLRNRALAAKPVFQEEFSQGEENGGSRLKSWAAFTAGAAGAGTGAFLPPLADFTAKVPFERMEPHDDLVRGGTAYVLAEPGQGYAAYLPAGGSVTLDLSAATGTLSVEWFDPRTGAWLAPAGVLGGAPRILKAPQSGDWAVWIHR
jgi:hypothetical protein